MNKHGYRNHRLYHTWWHMVARCNNPTEIHFEYYGGRGIKVHPGWVDNPGNFIDYVMTLPHAQDPNRSIDRIDNDGNYEPGNIRWATREMQMANSRRKKNNKTGFTGVFLLGQTNKYIAHIYHHGTRKHLGCFKMIQEAIDARNDYIKTNNLPHKLQTYE